MTIDDLFSAPERPRAVKAAVPRQLRALSLVLIAATLAGLVLVALRLNELTAPALVLFAAALTLVGGWRLVRGLRPPPPSRHAGRHREEDTTLPDGLNLAINRWDTMLDWCHTDVARYNRRVLPRIGELADERLRLSHGVTRASDPQRARSILGDTLWTQVTMPLRRPPSPRELDEIVTALEKL